MKRKIVILSTCCLLIVLFTACVNVEKKDVIGVWYNAQDSLDADSVLIINEDTYTLDLGTDDVDTMIKEYGTWEIKGNKLILICLERNDVKVDNEDAAFKVDAEEKTMGGDYGTFYYAGTL